MSSRSRHLSWLLAGALAVALTGLPAVVWAADVEHQHVPASEAGEDLEGYVEGASRLEGRIMAPCCWTQTIDIHGSEPAYELRREIRKRLKAGESADAIEASFVQRYGQRILAVPDSSPLGGLATGLAVAFGGVGVAGYMMLRRWSRAGQASGDARAKKKAEKGAVSSAKDEALDARLDQELSEIGHQP
jgi:cytochrome c-type biogenesis protein CcmH